MVMAEDTALEGLTVVDAAELAVRCQEIVDEAVSSDDRLVLTSDGRPIAYLERYHPPARPFYVRPSPEGDGASERVYREVVETIHRSVKVADLQAQALDLVEQTAANDWRVQVWNRNGPDAMLIRYFPPMRYRSSGIDNGDLVTAVRELRDEMAEEVERSMNRKFPP